MNEMVSTMVRTILAACKENDELRNALLVGLCEMTFGGTTASVPAPEAPAPKTRKTRKNAKTPKNWYDEFASKDTTVEVKGTTVQVTVARGHADEWHDALRSAGFRWSRGNRNWWAYLDDEKRAQVAERNRETDALTAGMTRDEKREYWRNRKAADKAA